jgi:hypothetical protein
MNAMFVSLSESQRRAMRLQRQTTKERMLPGVKLQISR